MRCFTDVVGIIIHHEEARTIPTHNGDLQLKKLRLSDGR